MGRRFGTFFAFTVAPVKGVYDEMSIPLFAQLSTFAFEFHIVAHAGTIWLEPLRWFAGRWSPSTLL